MDSWSNWSLTAIFLNIVYNDPSQGKAWGFHSILILFQFSTNHFITNNFGEHFQKQSNLVQNLIFQIGEALPLGALDYLHVRTSSVGSRIKPGKVMGHGWVERGSSQVIRLIDLRSELSMFLLILCAWVCRVLSINRLQIAGIRFHLL